jgi:hypothetical protein
MQTYFTGTVSVSAGATTVTGTGTTWSGGNAKEADRISIDSSPDILITAVTDLTHLEIPPWAGADKSGVPYIIYQNYSPRVLGVAAAEDVGTMIAKLKTGGLPFLIEPPDTEPDPSLGADGQYTINPLTGEQWIKTGGLWVSQGIFKAFGLPAPWSSSTAYTAFDVATLAGNSYICILANTNQTPPNATYWTVLAAVGSTGPAPFKPIAAWVTATAYVTGPPADYASQGGSSYECLTSHTSGTFATDLAAGKWGLVAQAGTAGAGYGGSSTTSFAIGTGSKAFTTQAGLAYQVGNYVRASSAAGGANFMEGNVTAYSGTTLTINITKVGGTGTHTDWNFSISGVPGAGDMLSTNNGSDFSNVDTTLTNLRGVSFGAAQTLTTTQQAQARTNAGMSSEVGKIETWPTSDVAPSRLKANGGSYLRATYPDLAAFLVKTGAATFTNGSSAVTMTAHNRSVGDPIKLFTTGGLPTNFTAGTHGLMTAGVTYYVKTVTDANTVVLALTTGGTAISAGSAGSGTHSWVCAPAGDGDGSTTFTVPDYRGSFLRAWDNGAGVDASRAIGDMQADAMQGHLHSWSAGGGRVYTPDVNNGNAAGSGAASWGAFTGLVGAPTTDGTNGTPRTAAETRPRNVSVNVTIRYAA